MRYLLIDRITRVENGRRIEAIKNVALSEDVFTEHFVGKPVMPGALLIESLAQAGTALLEISGEFKKKALLVMIEQAKFRRLIRPGDQLIIALEITGEDGATARTRGVIRVGDEVAATASLVFALDDIEKYYHPKISSFMEVLYETWLKDAVLEGFARRPL
jgi:3-hydroxyacyl-[acyl-carrier-protein] dehydratase